MVKKVTAKTVKETKVEPMEESVIEEPVVTEEFVEPPRFNSDILELRAIKFKS